MKKYISFFVFILIFSWGFIGCEKDEFEEDPVPPPPVKSDSWVEEFDDVSTLGPGGWVIINNCTKPGPEAWRQGRYETTNKFTFGSDYVVGFPAFSASKSPHDFISCDMYAGHAVSDMSVWLITPSVKMKNGDQVSFYTRRHIDDGSASAKDGNDRLQVRGNFTSASFKIGTGWTNTGDFAALLLDINPNLTTTGYPETWTKYTITLSGITGTISGRMGFRYFVANGGPDGVNASLIGIDKMEFISK
jgi:hypothetical protein